MDNALIAFVGGIFIGGLSVIVPILIYFDSKRANLPKIKVTTNYSVLLFPSENREVFQATISNHGGAEATIKNAMIGLKSGRNIVYRPHEVSGMEAIPFELAPRKSHSLFFPYKRLISDLRNNGLKGKVDLIVWFEDALGAKYKSKSFEVDIDQI